MVTRQEAEEWIGKPVDLMLSEYTADNLLKPDEVTAVGMTGVLEKVDEDNGVVWLVFADENPKWPTSEGSRAVRLDEVIAIEKPEVLCPRCGHYPCLGHNYL